MSAVPLQKVIAALRGPIGAAGNAYRKSLADRIEANGIAPPDDLQAKIHAIASRYMTKRNQGRFMGDIRAMLAAAPEVKP